MLLIDIRKFKEHDTVILTQNNIKSLLLPNHYCQESRQEMATSQPSFCTFSTFYIHSTWRQRIHLPALCFHNPMEGTNSCLLQYIPVDGILLCKHMWTLVRRVLYIFSRKCTLNSEFQSFWSFPWLVPCRTFLWCWALDTTQLLINPTIKRRNKQDITAYAVLLNYSEE